METFYTVHFFFQGDNLRGVITNVVVNHHHIGGVVLVKYIPLNKIKQPNKIRSSIEKTQSYNFGFHASYIFRQEVKAKR